MMRALLAAAILACLACGESKPANAPDDLPTSPPSGGPCSGTSPGPGYQCLEECGRAGGSTYRWMSPEDVEKRGGSSGCK